MTLTDPVSKKPIRVTVSARKYFRAMSPAWKHIKNAALDAEISTQFAKTQPIGQFRPHNGRGEGQIRGSESAKYIAVVTESDIAVIAVKGHHQLAQPKTAGRDDELRAERGWLENHYFDLTIGQYAIDQQSADLLRKHLTETGEMRRVRKMSRDELSQLAVTLMGEDQRGQMTRDPGLPSDRLGLLNTPVGFPL